MLLRPNLLNMPLSQSQIMVRMIECLAYACKASEKTLDMS